MPPVTQRENSRTNHVHPWLNLSPSEFSRLASRKYNDIADEARLQRGWKKTKCGEVAREWFPEFAEDLTDSKVYEWLGGEGDPHTSTSKILEAVLGLNLPPHCYWNAGKR